MTLSSRFMPSSHTDQASSAHTPQTAWPSDMLSTSRNGAWLLVVGLVCLLLWAALAPLEEGVPSAGTVVVDTRRKVVQHPSGGVIAEIMVREGAVVSQGQRLLRLDGTSVRANHDAARMRYLDLQAQYARLQAEQARAPTLRFSEELNVAAKTGDAVSSLLLAQQHLFAARQATLQADLMLLDEAARGLESQLASQEVTLLSRERQLSSVRDELRPLRELVKEGYAPLNRQREVERLEADAEAKLAELQSSISRVRSELVGARQRRQARLHEFNRDVQAQLAEVIQEVAIQRERLRIAQADLQRIEILSPASGQVVGLDVQTVGGVIQPGQLLMEIVPFNEPVTLEARVAPHLIDKVRVGLLADVRFSGFPNEPMLVASGRVLSVSADVLQPASSAQMPPHYLVRLQLTSEGRATLGERRLQPGMPVEVVIKTGERSVLSYLLGPLTRRMAAAMKEA